jgi:hypothetical protein
MLRHDEQPFSWQAAALFIVTGAGLWWYFKTEKAKQIERRGKCSSRNRLVHLNLVRILLRTRASYS